MALEKETELASVRFLPRAAEAQMNRSTTYYRQEYRQFNWADFVVGHVAGGLRAMAQTIENGVSKTVAAVAIIVIASAIMAVSWMSFQAYIGMTNLQTSVSDMNRRMEQGFTDLNKRLDDQRDRGNNGRSGGP